jgi:hypothetical protein
VAIVFCFSAGFSSSSLLPADFLFSAGTPDATKTGSTAPVRDSYGRTAGFQFLAYISKF